MNSIVRLQIRSFLGIKELDIKPGKVTVITGANEVGKTSIIEAIREGFQAKGKQPQLVRLGEDKAEILIDLGEMQVDRRITDTGNYLDVKTHGAKLDSPQSFLNDLIGSALSFNPVDFFLAGAKQQREMLLQAIPIVVTDDDLNEWFGATFDVDTDQHGLEVLSDVEKAAYELRHAMAAVKKDQQATVDVLGEKIPDGFDVEGWRAADVSQIHAEIQAAADAEAQKAQLEKNMVEVQHQQDTVEKTIANLKSQLEQKEMESSVLIDNYTEFEMEFHAIEVPDASVAKSKLNEYSEAKAILHDVDALEEAANKLVETDATWQVWDNAVTVAREKPQELLDQANIPIEGLVVTAEAITLNGVTIENLSDSQKVKFGLQVVKSLNPDFRVICIDGAEKLDRNSLNILLAEAADDDFQYFITRVVDDGPLKIETGPAEVGQMTINVAQEEEDGKAETT